MQNAYGKSIRVRERDGNVVLSGILPTWEDIVGACTMCVDKKRRYHVINDLKLRGTELPKMKVPDIQDQALEGRKPDVLIVGGGTVSYTHLDVYKRQVFHGNSCSIRSCGGYGMCVCADGIFELGKGTESQNSLEEQHYKMDLPNDKIYLAEQNQYY